MEFTAEQIASFLEGQVVGDPGTKVWDFAKIEEGKPGAISFLSNPKYYHYIYETKSGIVLVNQDFVPEKEVSATLIKVPDAYGAVARLLSLYDSMKPKKSGVSPLASIDGSAVLGQDVYVAPFAVIGKGVTIGDGTAIHAHVCIDDGASVGSCCTLYPHVTIYSGCKVENNCILHAGVTIGADGFGFAPTAEGYSKIPQIGIVVIEDNVELGSHTCVDRATMGCTRISQGVKLDNLVQVAHNVEIGPHTVMSAQCGVSGSAKIGAWSMFGGQTGVAGHISLGDKVMVGAQSGVHKGNISGKSIMGYPAMDAKNFARSSAVFKKLPDMQREIMELQRTVEELKKRIN